MFHDTFVSLFSMAIPIVAIVGGITLAIIRVMTRSRLAELARRERIAAIERGIDPDKLPPLVPGDDDSYGLGDSRLRRAHGLMIGGFVLVAVGIATAVFLRAMEADKAAWVLGLLPFLVGIALIGSSAVVWPRKG
jgi:hypothetical protein